MEKSDPIKITYYRCDEVRPNTWNPNKMNEREFEAEIESILHLGFVDPITVRENDGLEIIDGAHRLRALTEIQRRYDLHPDEAFSVTSATDAVFHSSIGWRHPDGAHLRSDEFIPTLEVLLKEKTVPCVNLGMVPDPQAKRMTIILNETRGRAEKSALSALLNNIAEQAKMSIEQLQVGLPYRENDLREFMEVGNIDWSSFEGLPESAFSNSTEQVEKEPDNRVMDRNMETEDLLVSCPDCGCTFNSRERGKSKKGRK